MLIFYSPESAMFALGQEVLPFRWNTGRECVAAPIVLSIYCKNRAIYEGNK